MTERIGTLAIEAIDKDKNAVRVSVHQIMHILHDYIPRSCFREAEEELFKAFFVNGIELTSNDMRKEYELWKKYSIELSFLTAKAPVQPINEE